MDTSDFFYELPKELIAQTPLKKRDDSRLLVMDKTTGQIEHRRFFNIIDYLKKGDCLVLNDSRVLPARIYGIKQETGAKVEFLLLKQKSQNTWECLAGPGKKARENTRFVFGENIMTGTVKEVLDNGNRIVEFEYEGSFFEALDKLGEMPLPPYITEKLEDKERYQTVYNREPGSAAAPTAGLHFTPELLNQIESMGIKLAYVTLHVGLGTFRPVKVQDVTKHKMHSEYYEIPQKAADIINETKQNGGRVICVGTTSCRTLEAAASMYGGIKPCSGSTEIFIYPPYKFKVMDGLITNFHLPESTLIMLVSAFGGYDNIMTAYKEAVTERYRFFSFGDAMAIL